MRIGVFDSGIGGLTVLRALRRAWPGHSTIYLGDTARVPYGTKSGATVTRYARQNAQYLIGQGIELLVIACNTASAYALEALGELPVPVVGVIDPGARAAARLRPQAHVGVIATSGTIASGAYERAITRLRPDLRISSRACPMFVPLVEEGWESTPIARSIIEEYLKDWLPGGNGRPDALVLGCTHYPVLKPALAEALGPEVWLIDSAEAVAGELDCYLANAQAEPRPTHRLLVTDGAPGFARIAQRLVADGIERIETIDLLPNGVATPD